MPTIMNFSQNYWVMALVILWTLPWKGVALWTTANKKAKGWFIALLILNTLGILEILYIFVFSKMKKQTMEKTVNF